MRRQDGIYAYAYKIHLRALTRFSCSQGTDPGTLRLASSDADTIGIKQRPSIVVRLSSDNTPCTGQRLRRESRRLTSVASGG